jgi:hypothetical protein
MARKVPLPVASDLGGFFAEHRSGPAVPRFTIKDSSIRFRIPISVSSYEVLDYDSVIVT